MSKGTILKLTKGFLTHNYKSAVEEQRWKTG